MTTRFLPVLLALATAPACINMSSERGIEATWNKVTADAFVPGETTRNDVLELLGPPSQILSLQDGSVFYYMLEQTESNGVILILYNDRNEKTTYDRAVFFFDEDGVLTEHAFGK
jgi:outer membrane protein assembly factor BamE (lipoprotein component of BamABCDE complex)